jgi:hypothetical protein
MRWGKSEGDIIWGRVPQIRTRIQFLLLPLISNE